MRVVPLLLSPLDFTVDRALGGGPRSTLPGATPVATGADPSRGSVVGRGHYPHFKVVSLNGISKSSKFDSLGLPVRSALLFFCISHYRRVAGLGGALSYAFHVTLVQTSPQRPPSVAHTPPRPSMRQRRPTQTPRRPDRFSRRDFGSPWRHKGAQDGAQERRPEHRDELHLAGYPRRQGQCHGIFSCLPTDRR